MPVPERCRDTADRHKQSTMELLDELGKNLGKAFSHEEKEQLWESGMWRMALIGASEQPPTPDRITAELIHQTPSADLNLLLYDYVCAVLSDSGCYRNDGPCVRDVLATIPRALRMVFTVSAIDGEISNGGFRQYFSNSSRLHARESVEDLRLIGALRHLRIAEEALSLIEHLKSKYPVASRFFDEEWDSQVELSEEERLQGEAFGRENTETVLPRFDQLDHEWYDADSSENVYHLMEQYVRTHSENCKHEKSCNGP